MLVIQEYHHIPGNEKLLSINKYPSTEIKSNG